MRVVDAGAGTGIFADAWPHWAEATVTAVEPSVEMIKTAAIADPRVTFVRGVAEELPLRDDTAEVVWVSTALHHFADLDRAIGEFARVLRQGGRVMVRTYVPDRTEITFADKFPGRSKWVSRFHREGDLQRLFEAHGFGLLAVRDVLEWTESYATSAAWVCLMRHADSMLTALTDAEIAEGLETLNATPDKIGRLELTLLVFETP